MNEYRHWIKEVEGFVLTLGDWVCFNAFDTMVNLISWLKYYISVIIFHFTDFFYIMSVVFSEYHIHELVSSTSHFDVVDAKPRCICLHVALYSNAKKYTVTLAYNCTM